MLPMVSSDGAYSADCEHSCLDSDPPQAMTLPGRSEGGDVALSGHEPTMPESRDAVDPAICGFPESAAHFSIVLS
jgi:hypothetical protein